MTTSELKPCPFCGVYWTEKEIEQQPEVPVSDIELLPLHYDELPEIPEDIVVRMQAYARANVAHAVAPLQAEIDALRTRLEDTIRDSTNKIEALREKVAEWKRVAAAQAELHDEAEARAERLAEALRGLEEREQRDEALLRQALEALEYYRSGEDYQPTPASEAITTIKERLK